MLRIDTISALGVPEYGVELELGLVSFEHYVIDAMGPEAADTLMRHLMGQSIHEASALGLSVDLERLYVEVLDPTLHPCEQTLPSEALLSGAFRVIAPLEDDPLKCLYIRSQIKEQS